MNIIVLKLVLLFVRDLPSIYAIILAGRSSQKAVFNCLANLVYKNYNCRYLPNHLKVFKGIKRLQLNSCYELIDINVLQSWHKLQMIIITNCSQVSDLQPLVFLPNLKSIRINKCNRFRIESVKQLNNLEKLYLESCDQLSDITSLISLTGLHSLAIIKCRYIRELAPLQFLINLKKLVLDYKSESSTPLIEIQFLESLTNLRTLE
eukprot:Pgem_evm1s4484